MMFTDSAKAANIVAGWHKLGFSFATMEAATGIAGTSLNDIRDTIRVDNEAAILATSVADLFRKAADHEMVPLYPSTRRMRSLQRCGFTYAEIDKAAKDLLSKPPKRIKKATDNL